MSTLDDGKQSESVASGEIEEYDLDNVTESLDTRIQGGSSMIVYLATTAGSGRKTSPRLRGVAHGVSRFGHQPHPIRFTATGMAVTDSDDGSAMRG